eukprot:6371097-Amphidinium_carterae.1
MATANALEAQRHDVRTLAEGSSFFCENFRMGQTARPPKKSEKSEARQKMYFTQRIGGSIF